MIQASAVIRRVHQHSEAADQVQSHVAVQRSEQTFGQEDRCPSCGPKVQAGMAIDAVIGAITGERLTSRVKRGFLKGKSDELKRRMKDRIVPLGLEF